MAEYSNLENRLYSGLEVEQNEYSNVEDDGEHCENGSRRDSDNGSQSGRSDHGSVEHRSDRDGHHDDDHSVHDREGDQSDREDGRIDREGDHSDREDGRSEGHSVHAREGSLHDGDDGGRDHHDGPRDQADDLYDALEESNVYDELVAQAEAQQDFYSNEGQDRRSDDGHSDGEDGPRGTAKREAVEGVRADVNHEAIYDELEHRSDSEGSEKGEHARGHDRVSDDLYDDPEIRDEHAHEHGHGRRGSHESDEVDRSKSSDDEIIKRQSSSTAPASSGKFMLRTSRKADALHVVRRIRESKSSEDNPEMDELVTILRSTDHEFADEDNHEEAKQKEKIKSFITSKLIPKFEQGIASDEAFIELNGDHSSAESSKVSESYHRTDAKTTVVKTTVVKTTVVKTTVKAEATSPVSPKSPSIPKSPPAAGAASGSYTAFDISHSSSSSSVSSTSQGHQKSGMTNSSRHPANELPKTPDEAGVPGWKAEIEIRKKTKSHVPTQKPKEPMKMSEVPEWKKQLQEKNKMKKLSSSDEPDITLAKVTTLLLNPSAASLPLKVEMGRLKHEMVINHGGRGDTLPEWARLADEKKKPISH